MIEYILLGFLVLFFLAFLCGASMSLYMINQRNKYVKRKEYDQRYNQGERKGWKW